MLMVRRITMIGMVGVAALTLAACNATSTAGDYRPANCAAVGSTCSSNR